MRYVSHDFIVKMGNHLNYLIIYWYSPARIESGLQWSHASSEPLRYMYTKLGYLRVLLFLPTSMTTARHNSRHDDGE